MTRALLDALPRWVRSPAALIIPLLLIAVPVAVSLLRDPDFHTELEVVPTLPVGNAGGHVDDVPAVRDIVANPGFQHDTKGWRGRPGFVLGRSTEESHSGAASLAAVRGRQPAAGGTVASTAAVFPAPGRYSIQARVRLSADYRGGAPQIALEGFSGSSRVAGRAADRSARGRWQLVTAEYVIEPDDLEGLIVLGTGRVLPQPGQVLHWDDVRVLSNDVSLPPPDAVNLVSNPGFEQDTSGWADAPAYDAQRSELFAHTGSAALRSSSDRPAPSDTNAAHTYVVLPRAGSYVVKAWVYVPRGGPAARPAVFLEGFSGSTQLAQKTGDPARRGTWQFVSAEYAISPQDLEGSLVLRDLPPGPAADGAQAQARGDRILHWDDVSVTAPRPDVRGDALGAAAEVRAALEEPQLRHDVSKLTSDATLYDPRHASVQRSSRTGTLSFIVTVRSDIPDDANRLAGPLRGALVGAARRARLRRAQSRWQQLIASVGEGLPPARRALLQRRAKVLERMIGAQPADAVAPRTALTESGTSTLGPAEQLRVHEHRQKVISRIGRHLPPWQRALVQQQADDLQRMIATDPVDFVVLPARSPVEPTRQLDRLLDQLPGSFPARAEPVWAGVAGVISLVLLLGMLIATNAGRGRAEARGR